MPAVVILCIKIFFCRILDVSLGTIRIIISVKGKSLVAALIGILEAMIWFLIVREALLFDAEGSKLLIALTYSAGFAAGTYIGGELSKKFVSNIISIQVVTSKKSDRMLDLIREAGYAITVLDINTSKFGGKKYMIFSEIKDNQLKNFKELIYSLDNKAFFMVHETKYVYNGFFKK